MEEEKDTITIDGFEFPKKHHSDSDIENLNHFLEGEFRNGAIRDYMSKRHMDLYPGHIGLWCKSDGKLCVVKWQHETYCMGEYQPHWASLEVNDPEKYKSDILEFYKTANPTLYRFISRRL